MKVELVRCDPNAEEHIVNIARVSSKRTDKTSKTRRITPISNTE